MKSIVRIANAGGYWGDDPQALLRQVTGGPIDYVTSDFLAEITMVILQRMRARDANLGYALDFVGQFKAALPEIAKRDVKVIVNAGGINPSACADAIGMVCWAAGVSLPIAVVSGDDVLPRLDELEQRGTSFAHMDGGRGYDEIRGKVVAANAYLGARPVVDALRRGAKIVITGRTTDAALILAPLVYEYDWSWQDWDRLAAGIVAGHVVECGAQATGGNISDWHKVPSMLDVGYPIVEVEPSGDFVVTKHPRTGGMVSVETVAEQLLYEIGDPRAYLTPDVTADFTSFRLSDEGDDRVRVSGVRGTAPPDTLKLSMVYQDGFRAIGTALVSGPEAIAKGERLAEMLWHRVGTDFLDRRVDFVGYRGCWGKAAPEVEPNEVVFRMGVADRDKKKVQKFANTFMGLALQGPPGLGVFGGRPDVQERLGFWPALVSRDLISAQVEIREGDQKQSVESPMRLEGAVSTVAAEQATQSVASTATTSAPSATSTARVHLGRLAYARSGDKGDHANIGVAARTSEIFDFLRGELSAAKIKEYFADLVQGPVERFELPNLMAFNFVLHKALGGGGTLSLRVDHQGKALAQGLLLMEIDAPRHLLPSE